MDDGDAPSESFLYNLLSSFGLHIILFVAACLLKWQYDRNRYRYPKGPRALSNLKEVISFYRMKRDKLLCLSREYPDCCTVLTQSGRIVLLNDLKTIEELFVEKSDLVSNKIDGFFEKRLRFKEGKHARSGIMYRHFDYNSQLIHRIFVENLGNNSFEKRLDGSIQREIEKLRFDQEFDVRRTMFKFAVRFLSQLCSSRSGSIIQSKEFETFEENLYKISKTLHDESLKKSSKAFFTRISGVSNTIDTNNELFQFVRLWFDDHQTENKSNEDFLDVLLNHRGESVPTLDDDDITACLIDIILHGSEMLKSSLSWILLYAVRYPEQLDDCRREARNENFGSFVLSRTKNLKKTRAFVKEVLRLSPIFPVVVHSTLKDFRWKSFHFQQRALFGANIVGLHLNSAWPNAETFDISRWDNENPGVSPWNLFSPFGFGPRSCVAQNRLIDILTGIMATFVFCYDFEKTGPLPDFNDQNFSSSNAPNKFYLKANPFSLLL